MYISYLFHSALPFDAENSYCISSKKCTTTTWLSPVLQLPPMNTKWAPDLQWKWSKHLLPVVMLSFAVASHRFVCFIFVGHKFLVATAFAWTYSAYTFLTAPLTHTYILASGESNLVFILCNQQQTTWHCSVRILQLQMLFATCLYDYCNFHMLSHTHNRTALTQWYLYTYICRCKRTYKVTCVCIKP